MKKRIGRPRVYANNAEKARHFRARRAAERLKYLQLSQMKVYHRSQATEWETPTTVFEALNAEFHFTLDACATPENAKCPQYYTLAMNSLVQPWTGVVFCNPPYGPTIGYWMLKAHASALAGATVVCLVPARTDTTWWQTYATQGVVTFIPGRLTFGGAKNPAPFPNALVVFRPPVLSPPS